MSFNILEKKIKISFKDKKLLYLAFTHKSFDTKNNNEKLEFLGDVSISKKSNFLELLFSCDLSLIFKSSDITLAVDSSACLSLSLRFVSLLFI